MIDRAPADSNLFLKVLLSSLQALRDLAIAEYFQGNFAHIGVTFLQAQVTACRAGKYTGATARSRSPPLPEIRLEAWRRSPQYDPGFLLLAVSTWLCGQFCSKVCVWHMAACLFKQAGRASV